MPGSRAGGDQHLVRVGLLPVTGIPLPMISAGGTSLITTMLVLGLLGNFALREPAAAAAVNSHGGGPVARFLGIRPRPAKQRRHRVARPRPRRRPGGRGSDSGAAGSSPADGSPAVGAPSSGFNGFPGDHRSWRPGTEDSVSGPVVTTRRPPVAHPPGPGDPRLRATLRDPGDRGRHPQSMTADRGYVHRDRHPGVAPVARVDRHPDQAHRVWKSSRMLTTVQPRAAAISRSRGSW
jgi:hypothetical protein